MRLREERQRQCVSRALSLKGQQDVPGRVFSVQVERGFKCDLASSAIIYFNLICCKKMPLVPLMSTREKMLHPLHLRLPPSSATGVLPSLLNALGYIPVVRRLAGQDTGATGSAGVHCLSSAQVTGLSPAVSSEVQCLMGEGR